jgi:flagellar biosynthesis/type III secretory pathway protein FliH
MTAETRKNWGTIFMGTDREVNLDQLSAVAPKGGGFWGRNQEDIYLERVRRRAEEQARTILAQAGQERAALLEEARCEIARMLEAAGQQAAALLAEHEGLKAEAARLHDEAARLHEDARLLHADAEEAGHAAGIGQAQAELEHFRAVMGESVGVLLSAIHAQCDRIFDVWKDDVCALLRACVEKGTGLVLDRDRVLLLEQLFLDSVKLFEARSSVLVRVRPEDEAIVADMVAAAQEHISGLAAWGVQGDPELASGDLVLETAHSRVESRIEERRGAVDEALRHVLLPVAPEEEDGREDLVRAHAGAVARMLDLVPKRPLVLAAPRDATTADDGAEAPYPEDEEAAPGPDDVMYAADTTDAAEAPCAEQPGESAGFAKMDGSEAAAAPEPSALFGDIVLPTGAPAPQVDLRRVWERPEATGPAATDAMDAADAVLAEGGFLPANGEV